MIVYRSRTFDDPLLWESLKDVGLSLIVVLVMLFILRIGALGWMFLKMKQVSCLLLDACFFCSVYCLLRVLHATSKYHRNTTTQSDRSSSCVSDQQQHDH